MAHPVEELLIKYASKGVLIDTSILLILLAGLVDRTAVERLSRNNEGYTAKDLDLLIRLVARFHRVVTTPQILAEVSNLSSNLTYKRREPHLRDHFAHVLAFLRQTGEEVVEKDDILSDSWLGLLPKLGVTDISILEAARRGKYLVLTDDATLTANLARNGLDVLNFTHIRFLAEG